MKQTDFRKTIIEVLANFIQPKLENPVKELFETLGYSTQRELTLESSSPDVLLSEFGWDNFRREEALFSQWDSIDYLFQVTEEEITQNPQSGLFQPSFEKDYLKSYLFLALTLTGKTYNRSQLATITREINRQSDIPIMVLFRYGEYVTFSVINRRPNKQDTNKDVLEKITLIKDINLKSPHRAHIEVLFDLSLSELCSKYQCHNFDQLHDAWQKVLDSSELNKRFFKELSDWYFWAVETVTFPDGAEKNEEIRNATSVIRLITRLIFVWFLKEKGLVPEALFNINQIKELLTSLEPEKTTYYKAILQNLFFATLNTEMNTESSKSSLTKGNCNRKFRGKGKQKGQQDQNFMSHNVYRYEDYFTDSEQYLRLCADIPFLNGGLFECLDKNLGTKQIPEYIRIDGFSDRKDNPLDVPNVLFFGEEKEIDLNYTYGTKGKKYRVQGLIHLFNRYKFTIAENTPIEEEIALDPELLGKVFENLLAEYNPETETTARKQTGSFYTPREIVNYMVDSALIAYLENVLPSPTLPQGEGSNEERLRNLFAYNDESHQFSDEEVAVLINAIDTLKILDPACGSGAFPMGILQKLVFILGKLDPNNQQWKRQQKENAIQPVLKDIQIAKQISYEEAREEAIEKLEERLAEIEAEFENNEMDYPRKLFLIENCIYGVDIQPVAVQIAKLRFFISLIVEQKVNESKPNRGILPLPNLETKFVAANALIGIESEQTLRSPKVMEKEEELKRVRQQHFKAKTPKTKRNCREKDAELREEISQLLKETGLESAAADTLARWNPYDLNTSSDFFDAEWMFGVTDGFDICIGNPPYGATLSSEQKKYFNKIYKYQSYQLDTYLLFLEKSFQLISQYGHIAFIIPNTWLSNLLTIKLRKYILETKKLKNIVHFTTSVFAAIVDTEVIIIENKQPLKFDNINIVFFDELGWEKPYKIPQIQWKYLNGNPVSLLEKDELLDLANKLRQHNTLEKICCIRQGSKPFQVGKGKPPQTRVIVDQKPYVQNFKKDETFKPLLRGNLIKKFQILWNNNYWISFGDWLAEPRYSANYDAPEKIVIRQTGDSLIATLDNQQFIIRDNLYSIFTKNNEFNIHFILGCINSKLLHWFYQTALNPEKGEALAQVKRGHLAKLPIVSANSLQQKPVIKLVTQILEIKRHNPKADTTNLEAEIDKIVYQLYSLTEEEIALIEETTKRK